MAAHGDGTLVVYDKEKEDAIFSATEEEDQPPGPERGAASSLAADKDGGRDAATSEGSTSNDRINKSFDYSSHVQILKSVHSKNQKTNPVAMWKLSNQRINAFAFSPSRRHLAVVSEDGSLRIIDYLEEKYVLYPCL